MTDARTGRKKIGPRLWRLFVVAICLGSASRSLPMRRWWTELNSNLGGYYFAAHILIVAVLMFAPRAASRKTRIGLVLLQLVFCIQYVQILRPFYFAPPAAAKHSSAKGALRLFYANILASNSNHEALRAKLAELAPDVVSLVEVSASWESDLDLSRTYPYKFEIPREDNFGIALYSRYEMSAPRSSVGEHLPPVIMTTIKMPSAIEIEFALVHAEPPMSNRSVENNRLLLRRIANLYRHHSSNLILAGDLNAGPYSWFYQSLLKNAGLKDARWGYGLRRSWNMGNIFYFTLDHLLYRGHLRPGKFEVVAVPGSDHAGILAEFALF